LRVRVLPGVLYTVVPSTIQGAPMFSVSSMVQIYDHAEHTYNGKIGVIRRIDMVRGHTFYMVEIGNRLIACSPDELMEA